MSQSTVLSGPLSNISGTGIVVLQGSLALLRCPLPGPFGQPGPEADGAKRVKTGSAVRRRDAAKRELV
jgi:hypothetical protein